MPIDRSEALLLARKALGRVLIGAMCEYRIVGQVADAIETAAEGGRWYGETAEREACAKIADGGALTSQYHEISAAKEIAEAIRARGSK